MTRKDFELIAGSLRATKSYIESVNQGELNQEQKLVFDNLIYYLVSNLQTTNPQFNPERFSKACRGIK